MHVWRYDTLYCFQVCSYDDESSLVGGGIPARLPRWMILRLQVAGQPWIRNQNFLEQQEEEPGAQLVCVSM